MALCSSLRRLCHTISATHLFRRHGAYLAVYVREAFTSCALYLAAVRTVCVGTCTHALYALTVLRMNAVCAPRTAPCRLFYFAAFYHYKTGAAFITGGHYLTVPQRALPARSPPLVITSASRTYLTPRALRRCGERASLQAIITMHIFL